MKNNNPFLNFGNEMESKNNIKFNKNQKLALEAMIAGKNIFLTGPSGTGKSFLINYFKDLVKNSKNIAITSTTGISALLIGGTTLHSFLGIGLGNSTIEEMIKNVENKSYLKKKLLLLDILVIDEVSMLSPELLTKIEKMLSITRSGKKLSYINNSSKKEPPFGGVQIIATGDLLQLPVVNSEDFCFQCDAWKDTIEEVIELKDIIRQNDTEFQEVLNDIRFGIVSDKVKKLLDDRKNVVLDCKSGIKPTRIHTTNMAVNSINEKELDKLDKNDIQFYQYDIQIEFTNFKNNKIDAVEKIKKNCIAPVELSLCVGAQVMLLCNLDLEEGLANGSRGIIVDFVNDLPEVKFLNGNTRIIGYNTWNIEEGNKIISTITQIPLKLAWAVTVHKSQGCTLDYAEVDLSNVFAYGQIYVALSRVKNKEGLKIIDIDYNCIKAHPRAVEFYKNLKNNIK
jgi:ATP-dependent DNA helicase PIF1